MLKFKQNRSLRKNSISALFLWMGLGVAQAAPQPNEHYWFAFEVAYVGPTFSPINVITNVDVSHIMSTHRQAEYPVDIARAYGYPIPGYINEYNEFKLDGEMPISSWEFPKYYPDQPDHTYIIGDYETEYFSSWQVSFQDSAGIPHKIDLPCDISGKDIDAGPNARVKIFITQNLDTTYSITISKPSGDTCTVP
ncbi:MAG TPA: hypothetical protein VKR58_02680 [Aquella sp.]|nr:hypothetical protein [Aquella sp.]